MGERHLDDLARALAVPMPRRRALRLLGSTLIATAVPGLWPRVGLAGRSATCDAGCGSDVRACPRVVNLGTGPPVCCGSPARRYSCEGTIFDPVCVDRCKAAERHPVRGEEGSATAAPRSPAASGRSSKTATTATASPTATGPPAPARRRAGRRAARVTRSAIAANATTAGRRPNRAGQATVRRPAAARTAHVAASTRGAQPAAVPTRRAKPRE